LGEDANTVTRATISAKRAAVFHSGKGIET
jgi:hypothetical protein